MTEFNEHIFSLASYLFIYFLKKTTAKMLGKTKGKKWGTEDEIVGWHYQLNGHEFEQTLIDSEGQGSLASCSPCGHKGKHITHYKILPGLGEVCKLSKCKIRF